jgi:hypothetical protein
MKNQVINILEAYCTQGSITGKTSQQICDDLRETASLDINEVTEYLMGSYRLRREDDRLVWDEPILEERKK